MDGKEMIEKVASIGSNKTGDVATQQNKATLTGAAIGVLFGIYYSYSRKKNMLLFGMA